MWWIILLRIFGAVLAQFVLPLLEKKAELDPLLPIVERWVRAVETTDLKGTAKTEAALKQILRQMENEGVKAAPSLINTAIELAVQKLQPKT